MAKPQAIIDAIRGGDFEKVSEALDPDFDQRIDGHTALYWAVDAGQHEMASALLDSGADPDEDAPLTLAAAQSDHKMIELLIEHQADIDVRGPFGDSPLRRAHNLETLRQLLEAGANPDAQNDGGFTPLMSAVSMGPDAVQLLLDYGADPNLDTQNGTTALIIAASFGRTAEGRLLIQNGAEIDRWNDKEEICALAAAMVQGSAEFVGMLLDAGLDYIATNNEYLRLTDQPLISLVPDDETGRQIAAVILRRIDRSPF